MYICLCNAISESQIAEAAAGGASRPREIYAACGCRAQCGTCTRTIMGLLRKLLPDAEKGGGMDLGDMVASEG